MSDRRKKTLTHKDKSLKVLLTTGRTIEQGKSLVGTKLTTKAKQATAVCFLDPEDMEKLQLEEEDNIKITTSEGMIVVRAKKSNEAPHPGIAFMPLGIYANWLIPPGDAGIGVPQYKEVEATIAPTKEGIPSVVQLINELRKVKGKKDV